jgi:tetratricopeptide (TPR) repeat protein
LLGSTIGGYRIESEIGRGGMGVVYRARPADLDADPVAIKVIHPEFLEASDDEAYERFSREAAIGISIAHENVVRTLEVGRQPIDDAEDPAHFLVMELVEGQTLAQLAEEIGTVAESLLLDIARQVCRGLAAIHERGVVHRDLKPANVIITGSHHVKIMDLGVAKLQEEGAKLTRTGQFVGSLNYASPELFRDPEATDGRADLYALGVLLYELATGDNPFVADTVFATLQRQIDFVPSPLRQVNDRISAYLEALVARLLAKDAADRFPSAVELAGVLDEGEASSWWREEQAAAASRGWAGLPARRRRGGATALLGRETEVEALLAAWTRVREEGGRIALIDGPIGIGKTAYAEEVLDRIDAVEGRPSTSTGRTLAQGRALWPFVEALAHVFRVEELPPADRTNLLAREIEELLPEQAGMASALAAWILGTTIEGTVGADLTRDVLHASLAALLEALARRAPLAIHLDDVHRADRETIAFLPFLQRSIRNVPLLLLLGRGEEPRVSLDADWGETLRSLDDDRFDRVRLEPLSGEAVESILRERFRSERVVAQLGPLLTERSAGNPFRLTEILAHLEKRGDLRRTDQTWATIVAFPELDLPESVRELMRLRLKDLTDEDREVLDIAAVVGFRFDAGIVAKALEVRRIPLLTRLARLERSHRLVTSEGAAFRFADGVLQETVYGEIPDALRGAYHARVAEVMLEEREVEPEETDGETAFVLADHLLRAEQGPEAAPYLPRALAFLNQNVRTVEGADLAERGLDALSTDDPSLARLRLDVLLATRPFLNLLGQRDREHEVLEEALALSRELADAAAEAKVQLFRSGLLQATGQAAEAREAGEESLRLAVEADLPSAEADARMAIGVSHLRQGRFAEARPFFEDALALRREVEDRRGVGAALSNLGILHQRLGDIERAHACYEEARTAFEEIGNRRSEASVLINLGGLLKDEGKTEEALDLFLLSLKRKCEVGDRLGERIALRNLASVHSLLGRYEEALHEFEEALEIARTIGHVGGEAESLEGQAVVLALLGRLDEAVERAGKAIELATGLGESRTRMLLLRTLARILLASGKPEAARERLEDALAAGAEDAVLRMEVQLDLAWAAVEMREPREAESRLKQAEDLAKELGLLDYLELAEGLCSRAAALVGDTERARRLAGTILEGRPGEEAHQDAVAHAVLALRETGDLPSGAALTQVRDEARRAHEAIRDPELKASFGTRGWPARVLLGGDFEALPADGDTVIL